MRRMFISYERPFRMPVDNPRLFFHPVVINDYGLFKYPDYTLPLSVKMAEVKSRLSARYSPCALRCTPCHRCDSSRVPCCRLRNNHVSLPLYMAPTPRLLGYDPGYRPAYPPRANLLRRGDHRFGVF